jgi:hypothetical protein
LSSVKTTESAEAGSCVPNTTVAISSCSAINKLIPFDIFLRFMIIWCEYNSSESKLNISNVKQLLTFGVNVNF